MDVQEYMQDRIPLVDAALDKLVPSAEEPPLALHAAMRHLLFPAGKRLRPMLAMAGAEAVGGSSQHALPMASAVELIHIYSLVHDDLPCMDDDALRRGRPTVHVLYGEAIAVLAGDALQSLAFEVLALAAKRDNAFAVTQALARLAATAGSRQLVGGQADDLVYDPSDLNPAGIEGVHIRKSAALIAASITGGALLAGAGEQQVAQLGSFGLELGVAFQIADDLLDEDEEDQCSLVRALGHDGAVARAGELLVSALGRIDDMGEPADPLRELARFAAQRTV